MYGIQNYYGGYSSSSYGRGGSSGLFGTGRKNNSASMAMWNAYVPNYAQMYTNRLTSMMYDKFNAQKEQLSSLAEYNESSKSFYSDFSTAFSSLKSASSKLKSYSNSSVFHPAEYGSSNSGVATVKNDSTWGVSKQTVSLNVKQTAQAQTMGTQSFDSKANGLAGNTTLTLTSADKSKSRTLSFNFSASTDNKTALTQIADSVNRSGMGVSASVQEKDGKSALILTAKETGTQSAFTAEFQGDKAASLSAGTTQEARDAIYSQDNGEEIVSQSNTVKLLDGKLEVTLTGSGKAELAPQQREDERIVEAAKQFASSYNQALTVLNKHAGKSFAISDLAYSFSSTRFASGSLSQIGIQAAADGSLSVNETAMKAALKDNPRQVEKLLGGAGGLADVTHQKASNAMSNSRGLYPAPRSVGLSNYMYRRDMNYVSSYRSGLFLSALI